MADYSKKALYLRKEIKEVSVVLDKDFLRNGGVQAGDFNVNALGEKDTTANIPAGVVIGGELTLVTPIDHNQGGADANIAKISLRAGAGGVELFTSDEAAETALSGNGAGTVMAFSTMRNVTATDLYVAIQAGQQRSSVWTDGQVKIYLWILTQPS